MTQPAVFQGSNSSSTSSKPAAGAAITLGIILCVLLVAVLWILCGRKKHNMPGTSDHIELPPDPPLLIDQADFSALSTYVRTYLFRQLLGNRHIHLLWHTEMFRILATLQRTRKIQPHIPIWVRLPSLKDVDNDKNISLIEAALWSCIEADGSQCVIQFHYSYIVISEIKEWLSRLIVLNYEISRLSLLTQETMSPIYHGKNQTSFNVKSLIKFRTTPLVQKWEQIQNLIQDFAREQKLRSKSEYVLRENSNYVLPLWLCNLIVIIFWLWFTLHQGVKFENKIKLWLTVKITKLSRNVTIKFFQLR